MGLKSEVSIGVALATGAVVWGIYSNATPNLTDIRVAPPGDTNVDATRKSAAWTATAVVAGISLIAKDATVFIIGGSLVVVLDWLHRHANAFNPDTGRASMPRNRNNPVTMMVNDTQAMELA